MRDKLIRAKEQLEEGVLHYLCHNLNILDGIKMSGALFDRQEAVNLFRACKMAHARGESSLTAGKLAAYSDGHIPRTWFASVRNDTSHQIHTFDHLLSQLKEKAAVLSYLIVWDDPMGMAAIKHFLRRTDAYTLVPVCDINLKTRRVVIAAKTISAALAEVWLREWTPCAVVYNACADHSIATAAATNNLTNNAVFAVAMDEIDHDSVRHFLYWLSTQRTPFRSVVIINKDKWKAGPLLYLSSKYKVNIVMVKS